MEGETDRDSDIDGDRDREKKQKEEDRGRDAEERRDKQRTTESWCAVGKVGYKSSEKTTESKRECEEIKAGEEERKL